MSRIGSSFPPPQGGPGRHGAGPEVPRGLRPPGHQGRGRQPTGPPKGGVVAAMPGEEASSQSRSLQWSPRKNVAPTPTYHCIIAISPSGFEFGIAFFTPFSLDSVHFPWFDFNLQPMCF